MNVIAGDHSVLVAWGIVGEARGKGFLLWMRGGMVVGHGGECCWEDVLGGRGVERVDLKWAPVVARVEIPCYPGSLWGGEVMLRGREMVRIRVYWARKVMLGGRVIVRIRVDWAPVVARVENPCYPGSSF